MTWIYHLQWIYRFEITLCNCISFSDDASCWLLSPFFCAFLKTNKFLHITIAYATKFHRKNKWNYGIFVRKKRTWCAFGKTCNTIQHNEKNLYMPGKIIANATAFLLNIEWILHLTFVHGLPMSSRSAMIFLKKTNKLSDSMHITWGKLKLLVLFIFSIINVLQVLTTNLLHSISSINSR